MALHPIEYLQKIVDFVAKIAKVAGLVCALLLWAVGTINKVLSVFVSELAHGLDSLDVSAFKNVALGALDYIGYVNAIFPVTEFVVLISVYLTAWGTVIIFRWIKSLLPTISN